MTTIADLKRMVNEEKSHRNKRIRIAEADATRVTSHDDVPDSSDKTSVDRLPADRERRPVSDKDDHSDKTTVDGNPYVTGDKAGSLSDAGKAALAANTIWTGILTQLLNFNTGQQLAIKMGQQLAQQADLDVEDASRIALAVLRGTLEELDELASAEMQSKFPGVLDRTRG
jgi:hypothetical protein